MPKKSKQKKGGKSSNSNATPKPQQDSQVLPTKEAQLFKQVVKYYESKQYKKGIKCADQVLKSFPKNGETLAMKGLLLNCMKKKEDAAPLIKQGLALNVKSYVCWHVYGLYHRSERRYHEAIKCYQNALRIDKENQQILRDLSLLQIQRRYYEGFQETRRKILMAKSSSRNNWIAFAIGNHMAGHHKQCLKILEQYHNIMTDDMKEVSYENSEMFLYRNLIHIEMGDYARALKHLADNEAQFKDKQSVLETKGQLNLLLNQTQVSEEVYRQLLDNNPNNSIYHMGVRHCLGLTPEPVPGLGSASSSSAHSSTDHNSPKQKYPFVTTPAVVGYSEEQIKGLTELYADLAAKYPKCAAVRRLPLDFLQGDAFRAAVDKYMRAGMRRGVPSLFRDMKPLYADQAKCETIETMVLGWLDNLRSRNAFTADEPQDGEAPSVLVWALYYMANHYDYVERSKDALALVDEAIAHTPTVMDLHMCKARIYKHAGDHAKGFECMNHARKLDLADRYLNTKCVRYAFRHGDFKQAEEIVALFLRDSEKVVATLFDMQVMWYEVSAGEAYARKKRWGRALKQFDNIRQHFEDICDDQFDFHTYCLRKMTLRAYIDMIRWTDNLRSHRFFFRAGVGSVKAYLALYDATSDSDDSSGKDTASLSEEEKKRREKALRRKRNKEKAKQKAIQKEEDAEEKDAPVVLRNGVPDEDPFGKKLASAEDPLAEATKWMDDLLLFCGDRIESHLLAFQLYLRKKKPLLCLRALKAGLKVQPGHAQLHANLVRFFLHVDEKKEAFSATVNKIIAAEREELLGGQLTDIVKFHDGVAAKTAQSQQHRVAVADAEWRLQSAGAKPADRAAVLKRATDLSGDVRLKWTLDALDWLQSTFEASSAELNAFKAACAVKFPLTPDFRPAGAEEEKQKA